MKIIIIGLGLIGGSIAKSLSSSNNHEILAFDIDQSSMKIALENKSISGTLNALDDLGNAEFKDSLVIISTPPNVSIEVLQSLHFLFNSSVTITDTTSAKNSLQKSLKKLNFPKNIKFSKIYYFFTPRSGLSPFR